MKILSINGSPRKNSNTSILIEKALAKSKEEGWDIESINLYDYVYSGCKSCFSCKLINGKGYGECAIKDELKPILDKLKAVDGIILASPIYFGSVTGQMKAFLERFIFPYLVYDQTFSSLFPKRIPIIFIYTLGVTEEKLMQTGWLEVTHYNEYVLNKLIGPVDTLYVTDTYQFDDYSRYISSAFDVNAKKRRRENVFPLDCQKAYEMGKNLVLKIQHETEKNSLSMIY